MFIRLIKLNERYNNGQVSHYLTEVSVNAQQILFITENYEYKKMLTEGKLNLDLNANADFTDIRLSKNQTITVVGTPSMIETKILSNTNKQLLRG